MNADFLLSGVMFTAAAWVLTACVWRLNLLQWGRSQCSQLLAYLLLAVWAASYVLGLRDLHWIGLVGVALLFLAGRKRWLVRAPEDTERGRA